jgi:hypothetical protein
LARARWSFRRLTKPAKMGVAAEVPSSILLSVFNNLLLLLFYLFYFYLLISIFFFFYEHTNGVSDATFDDLQEMTDSRNVRITTSSVIPIIRIGKVVSVQISGNRGFLVRGSSESVRKSATGRPEYAQVGGSGNLADDGAVGSSWVCLAVECGSSGYTGGT